MTRMFLSTLMGLGMISLLGQIFLARAVSIPAETYPLVCRGAPSLEIQNAAPGAWEVGFTFTRGTKPAGKGLAPGQCSWMDRGMSPDEPDRLYQNVEGQEFPPGKKPWFLELHSSDKYWIFDVSNQLSKYGWRELTATRARPMEVGMVSTARLPYDLEVSYPLVCRGAPSLVMKTNLAMKSISLTFIRGDKPASAGLAPGECSFKDRGVRPEESDKLSQYVEETETLKEGGTLAPENRWYEELHSPDKYWTFMVFAAGRRQFNVTSARPKG